jgi:hypothetical protein
MFYIFSGFTRFIRPRPYTKVTGRPTTNAERCRRYRERKRLREKIIQRRTLIQPYAKMADQLSTNGESEGKRLREEHAAEDCSPA